MSIEAEIEQLKANRKRIKIEVLNTAGAMPEMDEETMSFLEDALTGCKSGICEFKEEIITKKRKIASKK